MGVDQDRQETARPRRKAIIEALNEGFDRGDPNSHVSRFRDLVDKGDARYLVTNADVDGLVSAQMLAAATGWTVAALFDRTGDIRWHPDFESPQDLIDTGRVFGVDIFSPLFSGISNHPVYFGATSRTSTAVRDELKAFDDAMRSAVEHHHILNLSAWVGIGALRGSAAPNGLPYKYPLGTAQLLLAVLEAAELNPRIYDRQYLPWLIANCDGGVDTIRTYAWNAETWWSALAAVVGPASHSEAIYRMVTNQRPNEFLDMDRRLRYEEPERARFLNTKWNLTSSSGECISAVSGLISDLSGWPDPFLGGLEGFGSWLVTVPTRNVMNLGGITKLDPEVRKTHLNSARRGAHVNFSVFKERGTALGWSLTTRDGEVEDLLGTVPLAEEIPDDQPSVPDL
ncbi:hypothetical protein [uncultured Ornithinimicrobium sp.]|uniref:hypothetical protein n=1 Tax=uncultured Ornithinimicrobium sp. TaxID=259307 RepID=UPI0025987DE9|nr:hypothetical protein [uncultured Ornithinimicrobium sp.]